MGKSGAESALSTGQTASALSAMMASKLFKQTEPLRQDIYGMWGDVTGGGLPSELMPVYSAMRRPIEEQYDVAQQNIMGTVPEGGKLYEDLANLETQRAEAVGGVAGNLIMDLFNKIYGAAFQAPQTSISGLNQVAQTNLGVASGVGQSASGICCFNFLEAEGEIYRTVRMYRDQYYRKDGLVSKGYIRSAFYLVPLMRKYIWAKKIIKLTMTRPLKKYSQWFYGENRYGFIFWPVAKAWINSWKLIGLWR